MEPLLDTQSQEIFENVFAFYGTLSPEGYLLGLSGKIFDETLPEPNILVGQKFSETAYWQSSEFTAGVLENAITEAAEGDKVNTQLDFRINSKEKITIELCLQPIKEGREIFFCARDVTDRQK